MQNARKFLYAPFLFQSKGSTLDSVHANSTPPLSSTLKSSRQNFEAEGVLEGIWLNPLLSQGRNRPDKLWSMLYKMQTSKQSLQGPSTAPIPWWFWVRRSHNSLFIYSQLAYMGKVEVSGVCWFLYPKHLSFLQQIQPPLMNSIYSSVGRRPAHST